MITLSQFFKGQKIKDRIVSLDKASVLRSGGYWSIFMGEITRNLC